jgi:transcriptional regulator with XRE-family HTH domain
MDNLCEISKENIKSAYKTIGLNVKKIRKSKGISQLELSHLIGHKSVSVVSCAEICHNNHHFNIEHLLKISHVLDVDICEFFVDVKLGSSD